MANVEVAYAKPQKQWIISIPFILGMRIRDAIQQSGILEQCPEIDLDTNKVGVFGEILNLDTQINKQARVEIYRPLKTDPMTKRFERVKQERKQRKRKS